MKKLEIKDLNKNLIGTTVSVNGIIEWKEKRTNDDNLYLQMRLDDGTGRIQASIYAQSPWVQKLIDIPQFTRVVVTGRLGKVATTPRSANLFDSISAIEVVDVNRNGNIDIGKIQEALREEYKKIADSSLRKLVNNCMKDIPNFFEAPYSNNHYAYQGGLALYTLRCLQLAETIVASLTNDSYIVDAKMDIDYDMDMVRAGLFLHRIGKTSAYGLDENGLVFKTLPGQMNGDVIETIRIVAREMDKVELAPEKKMLLEHLIASSKKLQIWGALTEPKTKEAHLVHSIEQLALNHSQYEAFNVSGSAQKGELNTGAFNKRYYIDNQQ